MAEHRVYYRSPIGVIEIIGTEQGVTAVNFVRGRSSGTARPDPFLGTAVVQIDEYFCGKRRQFSLPLSLGGTGFQKEVWRGLVGIPYGETVTYSELARAIGRPKASRAVGQANHRNPISIIIPCHRVIGSDGRLVGYGGGLWRKEWLLAHERKNAGGERPAGWGGGKEHETKNPIDPCQRVARGVDDVLLQDFQERLYAPEIHMRQLG
jgi:methylated-DNA-[protein]-cysteine S-methyltransferase